MIGSGGDQAARQDMFPTQVSDWQTQKRVGIAPIGKGSSFDVQSPIAAQLQQLAKLRDAYPVLSTGASYVRYAKDAALVVQRVDLATGQTVIVAFNNSDSAVKTGGISTGPYTWKPVWGSGTIAANAATLQPLSATLLVPDTPLGTGPKLALTLQAKPDDLTSYVALTTTTGGVPASVSFAIRRNGGAWQRVATDDSPPYRAFVDPLRFRKHEHVQAVAVARVFGGTISVSQIATFTPNG